MCIYPLSLGLPSHLGPHRALSRVPCAIQQMLISHLFDACMLSPSVVFSSLRLLDCILPGSSVRGILQARILEGVAIPLSRGSSSSRYQTRISCVAGGFFTTEPPGKPTYYQLCLYVNPNLLLHPTLPLAPWCPQVCFLCLCLCFCFVNKIIYIIFTDSTYIYVNMQYLFFSF